MLNTKKYDPVSYIDELVELAQVARKNGLLALEERANQQEDPFFRQAIMLIVDATDPDKVRSILNNDIECMSARHDDVASMYEKGSSVAPAFGMVGTLVGLIKHAERHEPGKRFQQHRRRHGYCLDHHIVRLRIGPHDLQPHRQQPAFPGCR